MKHLIVYCCVYTCSHVLWTMDFEVDVSGYFEYEAVGDACKKCEEKFNRPPKFTPVRFGATEVTKPQDFDALMAKRKLENRKASGKGAPRGHR